MYKVWITTECPDEDPYTFFIMVDDTNPSAALEQVKGRLMQAYKESFAEDVITGPVPMTWWIDGHADQMQRALMAAIPVAAAAA